VLAVLLAALACEQPRATFDFTIESCLEGAQSLKFDINCSSCNGAPAIHAASGNVIDAHIADVSPGVFTIVAHLDQVALKETVELTFDCVLDPFGGTPQEAAVSHVAFYSTAEPGDEGPCPPSGTPTVTMLDTACGPRIDFSNTHNPAPVYVPLVQMASVPLALDAADLHWGNATLESLDWCSQFTSQFVLINPFDNVFSICLNDASAQCGGGAVAMRDGAATGAVLLRFESLYNGLIHRGIVQIDLTGGPTVTTEETSWGRVKVLYRH
jgi:hypothetical protein